MSSDRLILIFTGTDWEAQLIRTMLGSAGIPCMLRNEKLSTFIYQPMLAEGVQIMVNATDEEDARKVVEDFYLSQQEDN